MELVTLNKADIKLAEATARGGLQMTSKAYDPKTEEECIELYKNAEEISNVAKLTLKDGIQGRALLNAKKIICGDEWSNRNLTYRVSEKWKQFYLSLGAKLSNVNKLLDFAGYKEQEEQRIEAGENITPIPTASHYREVKKIAGKDGDVSKTYTDAVNLHDGEQPSTAKEVKRIVTTASNLVPEEEMFQQYAIDTIGMKDEELSWGEINYNQVSALKLSSEVRSVDTNEWDYVKKSITKQFHPDTGDGDDTVMSMISMLDKIFKQVKSMNKNLAIKNAYDEAHEGWLQDNGYNKHSMVEPI